MIRPEVYSVLGGGGVGGGIFGSEFQYDEGTNGSTTASWLNVARITTPSDFPEGNFIIQWQFQYRQENDGPLAQARVQIDDTTTIFTSSDYDVRFLISRHPGFGFKWLPLTAGVHTIDLDIGSSAGFATTYYYEPRLSIFRES